MIDFDPKTQIVYEDNHIIIINKYPSQLVQQDQTKDPSLNEQIKDYLKVRYDKPGNVFLGVVHRLDRPVSGAVIFARTSKALSRLNAMLKEREIKKTYWAVVKNRPEKETAHLIHNLFRDSKKNKSFIVSENKREAKKAELIYTHISSSRDYHLLEVELLTGRHHQIRAQLAFVGCPIKGDLKYGYPRSNENASIHLHARSVAFVHPVSKEQIHVFADPPADPLWDYFCERNKL